MPSEDPRIAQLLADAERKWGRGVLVRWGDVVERGEVEVIPTGFPSLDGALGIGGLPCGRISEVFGPDTSGKRAIVARMAAQCQGAGGVVAYLDPGRKLDPEQLRAQGVDPGDLLVARPSGWPETLEMAVRLARSGGIRLMVMDDASCPSLVGIALRRLVAAVDKNGVAFLFLSDARPGGWDGRAPAQSAAPSHAALQGVLTGPAPSTPRSNAGQALRYFASVRISVERRGWIRRGREVVGCRSFVRVVKNKMAAPFGEAEVDLQLYRFPPSATPLQALRPAGSTGRRMAPPAAAMAVVAGG